MKTVGNVGKIFSGIGKTFMKIPFTQFQTFQTLTRLTRKVCFSYKGNIFKHANWSRYIDKGFYFGKIQFRRTKSKELGSRRRKLRNICCVFKRTAILCYKKNWTGNNRANLLKQQRVQQTKIKGFGFGENYIFQKINKNLSFHPKMNMGESFGGKVLSKHGEYYLRNFPSNNYFLITAPIPFLRYSLWSTFLEVRNLIHHLKHNIYMPP